MWRGGVGSKGQIVNFTVIQFTVARCVLLSTTLAPAQRPPPSLTSSSVGCFDVLVDFFLGNEGVLPALLTSGFFPFLNFNIMFLCSLFNGFRDGALSTGFKSGDISANPIPILLSSF